ncbi:hypothetical protein ACFYMR_16635 [Streptomyces albogriseolus]|uniref:hypothetical protein n=1 Tax=Streptomyces albogriseolus TaxID=1887 RepID=UPI003695F3D9
MNERQEEELRRLREELRAYGRSLDAPDGTAGAETMAERVLARILAEHTPVPEPAPRPARLHAVRRWTRARLRSLLAALCGLLTVLVLTPPVRATVSDWFGFHGVQVRHDPSAAPSPGARVPGCAAPVRLEEASRRAGFTPVVPEALGPPDAVSVGALPHGRSLVSLCWRSDDGRTIRLDQFPGRLDLTFTKTVREQPEWLDVGGQALWFPRPHVLTFWMIDAEGRRFTREERTAGPTLLWSPTGEVTLRLEGVWSRTRAHEIATSNSSPSGV